MRKYNRRILTALVVAYKKGIINRKPLNKWLNFNQIFYRSMKYIAYLILFSFIFFILDRNLFNLFNLNEDLILSGYIVKKSRVVSGFILGILGFILYRLGKYFYQVYVVKKAMKKFSGKDFDIEMLNKVTFKIHV